MAIDTQRWTYKIIRIKLGFLGFKPEAAEDEINRLGKEGWELVSTFQGYGQGVPTLFFKRPA
jgi:hypothetical protein